MEFLYLVVQRRNERQNWRFFCNFIRNPIRNASVLPSSRRASRSMFEGVDWTKMEYVIELGPGTGSFTRELYANLPRHCKVLIIELNADYIPSLQRRFGDRFEIIEGSADDFEEQMKTRNWPKADLVVSGLPFTLPKTVQDKLYASLLAQTEQGAVFRWFTYFPFLMKPHFRAFSFRLVKGVWFNLPPLWVYTVN